MKPTYIILALAGLCVSAQAQTNWNIATGGNWDTNSNWSSPAFPNAVGADARITNLATAGAYAITASTTQTFSVGRLDFGTNSAAVDLDMSLNSNAGLIFDVASGNAQFNLATGGTGSTMTINSAIQLNDNTTVTLARNGGTQIIPTFAGAINLQGNTLTFGSRQAGIALSSAISGTGGIAFTSQGTDRSTTFTNSASTFSGGVNFGTGGGDVITLGSGSTYTSNTTQGILGTGMIVFNSTTNSTSNPRSGVIQSNGAFFSNDSTDTTTNLLANAISIASGKFGVIETSRPINTTGTITGAGKLYKTGGSSTGMRQWAVNNDNTGSFTGTIELQDGQIMARESGAIPTSSTLIFNPTSAANGVALNTPNSVTIGATLQFQKTASGIQQFVNVGGGQTLTLSGNFSNTGSGTAGYIGVGRGNGNLTTSGGGYAVGTNSGVATVTFTGTGTLENPIGIVNGTSAASVLSLGNTGGTQTFSGNITGNGALIRSGTGGTTILSGTNSYSGTTTVTAGTLLVNGTHTSGGNYTVATGGILGGNGTISAAVTINGILAPGSGIDTIGTGSLTIGATGTLDNELGRSGVTPVSDLTNITGAVTLASGADLKLTILSGLTTPHLDDLFFLVRNDGTDAVTGVFTELNGVATTLDEGSMFSWNSLDWRITYAADNATTSFTGGNDIAITVIPEPSTWAILAVSLTALAVGRRRRG